MERRTFVRLAAALPLARLAGAATTLELPAELVDDKIRGGFLGQVIGDLNGLKHEMKYILEPGNVEQYTPGLPEGAWTDDDTDVEWPYILEMQRTGRLLIPYPRVSEIWKRQINRRIWCSHLYVRQLLDIGIEPPLTGKIQINPWADFNLSGQFVAESWGLISPGMPRTAASIGTYYTHVAVEAECVQSTQMVDAMIATAFLTGDMQRILDAGQAAMDPTSVMYKVVSDVRRWYTENPKDWSVTRRMTRDKYCLYGGQDMRDRNGVWLNGASTISAMLYGDGDFVQTVRHAFNFGWDADNNAAASGAILGVIKGSKALLAQGWDIKDKFKNTSRDNVPEDETITSFGDRLIALARINIKEQGGTVKMGGSGLVYRIPVEQALNVDPMPDLAKEREGLRAAWKPTIEKGIASQDKRERARASYLAICLDFAPDMKRRQEEAWARAVEALNGYSRVLQAIFYEAPIPAGVELAKKAMASGVQKPDQPIKLWV